MSRVLSDHKASSMPIRRSVAPRQEVHLLDSFISGMGTISGGEQHMSCSDKCTQNSRTTSVNLPLAALLVLSSGFIDLGLI